MKSSFKSFLAVLAGSAAILSFHPSAVTAGFCETPAGRPCESVAGLDSASLRTVASPQQAAVSAALLSWTLARSPAGRRVATVPVLWPGPVAGSVTRLARAAVDLPAGGAVKRPAGW